MAAAKNGWATQKRKAGERATPFGAVLTCLFFSMSAGKNPNPAEQISTALTWCHDQRQRGPLWKSSVALVKCLPLVEDSDSSYLATRREWGCLYLPPWSTSSHDRVMTECSTLVMWLLSQARGGIHIKRWNYRVPWGPQRVMGPGTSYEHHIYKTHGPKRTLDALRPCGPVLSSQ